MQNLHFKQDGLEVYFPDSKTDQLRRGEVVFVGRIEGSIHCPVLFLMAYTIRLQWEAFQLNVFPFQGHVFPSLRKSGSFMRPLNTANSRQAATKCFRELLARVGVPDPSLYTLHSGRRGGATTAAQNGCSFIHIKRQGRWRSDSCPQRYIDDAATRQNNFSRFLGL